MSATVERLPGQPIIQITVSDPFDPAKELPLAEQRFRVIASFIEGRVHRISAISQWNV